ncbi:MAG: hypothetical protein GX196_00835 [Clostridiaceae bacterium]|nr:hypothetical protein [Clostridiaceae bacterium]
MNDLPIEGIPFISATIALIFGQSMNTNELNFYGNLLTAIGSEMLTLAAARKIQEGSGSDTVLEDIIR